MNEYPNKGDGSGPRNHDDNGNLTRADGRIFIYDYRNRLVEVKRQLDEALIARYEYDVFNRRVKKTIFDLGNPGTVQEEVRYFYAEQQVIEELGDDEPIKTYVYGVGMDQPLQLETSASASAGAGRFYYHQDARHNVVALTATTGAVVEQTRYDDYGNFEQPRSIDNPYLFQGRRYDPETGLFYFRNRYYDPTSGRFLQRDPVWDPNNTGNQYTFVGNNPVSTLDAFGLQPDWWNTPGGFNQGNKPSVGYPKGGEEAPPMPLGQSAIPITAVGSETAIGYVTGLVGGKVFGLLGKTPPGRWVCNQGQRLWNWAKGKFTSRTRPVPPVKSQPKPKSETPPPGTNPAGPPPAIPGPGTLTAEEVAAFRAAAREQNATIRIGGSRVRGEGRHIDTSRPIGEKPHQRSDIDVHDFDPFGANRPATPLDKMIRSKVPAARPHPPDVPDPPFIEFPAGGGPPRIVTQ